MYVECWNCGKIVELTERESCPHCDVQFPRFIFGIRIIDEEPSEIQRTPHPDPIKRKEAELAKYYYKWVQKEFKFDASQFLLDQTRLEEDPHTLPPLPLIQRPEFSRIRAAARIPEGRGFTAVYKIVGLGELSTRKTEIIGSVVTGKFEHNYLETHGMDISTFDTKINTHYFKILIWELASQDIFRNLHTRYCKGASGGLLFIDCKQPTTLETIPHWVKAFREGVGPKPPLYLLGTNTDIPTQQHLQPKEAEKIVKKYNLSAYYEIPTKHPETISEIINTLIAQIYQQRITIKLQNQT